MKIQIPSPHPHILHLPELQAWNHGDSRRRSRKHRQAKQTQENSNIVAPKTSELFSEKVRNGSELEVCAKETERDTVLAVHAPLDEV